MTVQSRMFGIAAGAATLLLLVGASMFTVDSGVPALSAEQPFDVILRGGTVIDGSGAPRYRADVGIRNGFIAEIGDLETASADTTYDVSGLFVTPGFVSVHSHADTDVLGSAKNMLTQGVTTEILNPDGAGPTDVAGQLQALEQRDLALNVGAYIGFNAVWGTVVGNEDRRPTDDEFTQMQALVREAMQAGAWGVSSGLQYVPGFYAETDEVSRVVKAAAPWRTQYTSHIRSEYKRVVQATRETITIGEEAGLAPIVTHMKVVGSKNWGETRRTLDLLRRARRRGTYAAADVYPYLAGQTSLTVLVPAEAQEGGFDAMLRRISDPEQRARIRDVVADRIGGKYGGAENVLLPNLQTTLAEVAENMEVPPAEAALRLFEREEHNLNAILFYGFRGDLVRLLQNPMVAVSCDCGATAARSTHPRYYGSWPKVLGQFVRERRLLTWELAIQKMTGLPATMLGMVRRGFIAEGMVADLTVFDPKTVIDRATYQNPKQYAKGIKHVFVRGRPALRRGTVTRVQSGRVLRRTAHMPTRPMSADMDRRVAGAGTLGPSEDASEQKPVTVDFAVEQTRADRHAEGHFRLDDPSRDLHVNVEGNELGKLQGTNLWGERWAAFTGTVRPDTSGEAKPLLVVVEENAPFESGANPTMKVRIGEDYSVSGPLDSQITLESQNVQE